MSTHELSSQERTDSEPTKAELRANWEGFEFRVPVEGRVRVENASYGAESDEHVYVVSVEAGIPFDCTCPAWEYHNPEGGCKHMQAVEHQPAVTRAASTTTGQQVATDGGTRQAVPTDATDTDDTRQQIDHWGQAVERFDDEPVGAGEKSECQSCGARFEIALVAATTETSEQWEEFYECQNCGAMGSFRVDETRLSRETQRTWTGRIGYPDE
jgi:DNA-directed RNA polymerase subunit M/transcription elongation factor TFIIS